MLPSVTFVTAVRRFSALGAFVAVLTVPIAPLAAQIGPAGGETFDPAESSGLFVGVRDFVDLARVDYAVDDAVDLAHRFSLELGLIEPGKVTLAVSGDPVKPESRERLAALVTAGATVTDANFTNLSRQIVNVPESAGRAGLLVVSVASHGFQVEGLPLIAAADTHAARLRATSVQVSDLVDHATESWAARRIILLDACRERVAAGTRSVATSVSAEFASAMRRSEGTGVLLGTTPGGFSYDDHARRNGVFTSAILDALANGAAPDERGLITLASVASYADEYVRGWVAENRERDIGVSRGISVEMDFMAGSIPLAEDPEGRRDFEESASRRDELIAMLPDLGTFPAVSVETIRTVAQDLERLDLQATAPLREALERFAASPSDREAERFQVFVDGVWAGQRPAPPAPPPTAGGSPVEPGARAAQPGAGVVTGGARVVPEGARIAVLVRTDESALAVALAGHLAESFSVLGDADLGPAGEVVGRARTGDPSSLCRLAQDLDVTVVYGHIRAEPRPPRLNQPGVGGTATLEAVDPACEPWVLIDATESYTEHAASMRYAWQRFGAALGEAVVAALTGG